MRSGLRVVRSRRFKCIDLEGGHLLYDGSELRLLAGPAAVIFTQVDGLSTAEMLADTVAATQIGDSADVRGDVLGFLDHLVYMRVLRTLPPTQEPGCVRPAHIGYVCDAGAVLLIDMQDGRRRALTPTGSRVWELICEHAYASRVVEAVLDEYPDAPVSVQSEVQALLDDLVTSGFLITV